MMTDIKEKNAHVLNNWMGVLNHVIANSIFGHYRGVRVAPAPGFPQGGYPLAAVVVILEWDNNDMEHQRVFFHLLLTETLPETGFGSMVDDVYNSQYADSINHTALSYPTHTSPIGWDKTKDIFAGALAVPRKTETSPENAIKVIQHALLACMSVQKEMERDYTLVSTLKSGTFMGKLPMVVIPSPIDESGVLTDKVTNAPIPVDQKVVLAFTRSDKSHERLLTTGYLIRDAAGNDYPHGTARIAHITYFDVNVTPVTLEHLVLAIAAAATDVTEHTCDGVAIALDVDLTGPYSWLKHIFLAVAQDEPYARDALEEACNALTDGQFGSITPSVDAADRCCVLNDSLLYPDASSPVRREQVVVFNPLFLEHLIRNLNGVICKETETDEFVRPWDIPAIGLRPPLKL